MTPGYERHWERGGGRSAGDEARTSYYGLPVVHKPHWKWLIISYFFLGGIAGASYTIASLAQWLDDEHNRPIARAGRYLSLLALVPSPLLLILDLHRPERFLNMLRVLKLRSPMSLGTWGLTLFGGFCTTSALAQASRDGVLGRETLPARLFGVLPARPIGLLGTIPAFFVAGYTGVLLAATAVPFWTRAHLLLGPLFLTSATSTATAALALALSLRRAASHETLRRLERLDFLALLAELALLLATRARLGLAVGWPIREGWLGRAFGSGVVGLGVLLPLALQAPTVLFGRAPSRLLTALAAALVLLGGFTLRAVMVLAGRASADDPRATFEHTRPRG